MTQRVPYYHRMTTFGLAHGAFHGADCWDLLTPLLRQAGHDVVAMDLPIDDGTASFDDYADVVCAALRGHDDVVLVGHSFGGATIPLVATRSPIRHLVYLGAIIPELGRSIEQQMTDGSDTDMLDVHFYAGLGAPDEQSRVSFVDLDVAREVFYADCSPSVADQAVARLRPQALYPSSLPCTLSEFPTVPASYVVCSEDRSILPEWSRRVAPERLGADVVELPGSHSPFLSRPSALADVLLALAAS